MSASVAAANGVRDNGTVGNYLNISSQNGAVLSSSDDGLVFRRDNDAFDATENDDNAQLIINAMAFDPKLLNTGTMIPSLQNTSPVVPMFRFFNAPAVRFCNVPDGVRIAFASIGDGLPLVKTPNWMNHLHHDWESPVWRPWMLRIVQGCALTCYDARGCGLSAAARRSPFR